MGALPLSAKVACDREFGQIADDSLCAGDGVGRVQTCVGDSGGPLLWLETLDFQRDSMVASRQLGIVSWGASCEKLAPYAMYTNISAHGAWLANATVTANACVADGACPAVGCAGSMCFDSISIAPPAPPAPLSPPQPPSPPLPGPPAGPGEDPGGRSIVPTGTKQGRTVNRVLSATGLALAVVAFAGAAFAIDTMRLA